MKISDSRFQALLKDGPTVRSGHEIKSDAISNRIKIFLKRWPWLYNFLREAIGPSHTLGSPYALKRRVGELLKDADAVVLNLGSGTSRIHPDIINVDLFEFKNVDVVGDICDMPFKDMTVDGIVCDSVMEHVANSQGVLKEMSRILKPGGTLIVTVPFLYPYHSSPDDYFRWTEEGVRYALKEHGFSIEQVGMRGGPMGSLHGVLMHVFAILFSFGSKTAYFILTQFFMALFSPLKIFDVFFRLFPYSIEIASDIFVIAKRNS